MRGRWFSGVYRQEGTISRYKSLLGVGYWVNGDGARIRGSEARMARSLLA